MMLDKRITIIRQNRRTLSMTVKRGEVVVKAPLTMQMSRIDLFLAERETWLMRALERDRKLAERRAVLEDGDTLMLCGEYIEAAPVLKKRRDSRLAVIEFYKRQFEAVRSRAALLSERTGLRYTGEISMSFASSYWGLCKGDGQIRLNFRLAMLPEHLQEYVIIHELIHTKIHNHSPAYWAALVRVLPDAKRLRRELKAFDYLTELYRRTPE